MSRWKVCRVVKESFDVEAETRQEALDRAVDPYSVDVIRETAVLNPLESSNGQEPACAEEPAG